MNKPTYKIGDVVIVSGRSEQNNSIVAIKEIERNDTSPDGYWYKTFPCIYNRCLEWWVYSVDVRLATKKESDKFWLMRYRD